MKVCIFGAGAIGGYVAAKLASGGEAEVSCVARGPHLAAMKANGLTLRSGGETIVVRPRCTDDARELGPQDFVVIAVKAHSLPAAAPSIQHLIGKQTTLVPAINGVPWWYFYKSGGQYENTRLQSVDPDGKLWDLLPPPRVVGCIVYPATDLVAPGVIEHTYSNRFDLGEPDGSKSDRAQTFSQLMIKAGLRAPVRPRIRENLWVKLWGNLSFNMICALTRSPLDAVIANPETRALARTMMVEGQGVAEKLGVKLPLDVDARIAGAAEVGSHKPSTLVDLEKGRPMEIDALLGAVVEMARLTSVPVPICASVLALVRQLARAAGCYPEPLRDSQKQ
jgi:2-dehydropantoate 2-reductase